MINNYLDLLTDDILERILDIVVELNIKDIRRIADNLKKVSKKMKNISIEPVEPDDMEDDRPIHLRIPIPRIHNLYYHINSTHITYCMDNFLYDRMPFDSICVIDSLENALPFLRRYNMNGTGNEDFINWIASKRFKSKIVKNPIYLDFLLLLDDITDKKEKYFKDNRRFLTDIIVEPHKRVKEFYNFEPKEGITYLRRCRKTKTYKILNHLQ